MKHCTRVGSPGATQSGAWLSRKDWRRALHLYLDGRVTRAEFEKMKERLMRVRVGRTATVHPPEEPRVRLVTGGLEPSGVPEPSEPTPTPPRLPRKAA